jgi:hypothetical protein
MAKTAKDSDVPTGKLSRNYYEKEMTRLQGELVQMQLWVSRKRRQRSPSCSRAATPPARGA